MVNKNNFNTITTSFLRKNLLKSKGDIYIWVSPHLLTPYYVFVCQNLFESTNKILLKSSKRKIMWYHIGILGRD